MVEIYSDLAGIPFNFLIGDDGFVYESRGFFYQGEIVNNDSPTSFDDVFIIALIGTFVDNKPSDSQMSTFNNFLNQSVRQDYFAEDFTLLLQDQLTMTEPAGGLQLMLKLRDEFHSSK